MEDSSGAMLGAYIDSQVRGLTAPGEPQCQSGVTAPAKMLAPIRSRLTFVVLASVLAGCGSSTNEAGSSADASTSGDTLGSDGFLDSGSPSDGGGSADSSSISSADGGLGNPDAVSSDGASLLDGSDDAL